VLVAIESEIDTEAAARAARIALELGADSVLIKHTGDQKGFEWVVHVAGSCHVLAADRGLSDTDTLHLVADAIAAGASGVVLGKTVWQHHKPFSLTRALHSVVFKNKSAEEAIKYLE
jgi:DhnA family fructose-bisphosphate aldolase class Ia